MNDKTPVAWLIKNCPDFYFMPSTQFDQIFADRGSPFVKMSCAYWESVGFEAIPLVPCDDDQATHWVVNNSYGAFDRESADAARYLGKVVMPVKIAEKSDTMAP